MTAPWTMTNKIHLGERVRVIGTEIRGEVIGVEEVEGGPLRYFVHRSVSLTRGETVTYSPEQLERIDR